ncbi:WG repeat-containing protein [Paenibacillus tengchongensis]|uniref:WG repeat-containing protein n=1 Tax=Paenibacillus tengchongensis TaxID=2608684 RepID=UPI001FE3D3A8|nr:WG repeat-containing protein [Paenibacillus tengchongensis]
MKILKSLLIALIPALAISATSMAAAAPKIQITQKPLDYQVVRPSSDGEFHDGLLYALLSDGSYTYYNVNGQPAFQIPDYLVPDSDFYEQRAIVKDKRTNLYGYMNTLGQLAVPCIYSWVGYFSDGVATVKKANTQEVLLIDRFGKTVSELNLPAGISTELSFSEGLAVSYDLKKGTIGYVDRSGRTVISYRYTDARDFHDGLALTRNSKDLYGYINAEGNTVIPHIYKSGGYFSGGLVAVQNSKGKWGFVNKQGKTVIPFQYYGAGNFSEGLAHVSNAKGQIGFINTSGKLVIPYGPYTRASAFKEGAVLVGIGTNSSGKFGYMDRSGKLLTKLEYTVESSDFYQGTAVALKLSGVAVKLTKQAAAQ